MIDGEVVALDQKGADFGTTAALSRTNPKALCSSFDCCSMDERTYSRWRAQGRLQTLLEARGVGRRLHFVTHLESSAQDVYSSACKWGSGASSRAIGYPPLGPIRQLAQDRVPRGQGDSHRRLDDRRRHGSFAGGRYRAKQFATSAASAQATGAKPQSCAAESPDIDARDQSVRGREFTVQGKNVRWLKPSLVAELSLPAGLPTCSPGRVQGLRQDKWRAGRRRNSRGSRCRPSPRSHRAMNNPSRAKKRAGSSKWSRRRRSAPSKLPWSVSGRDHSKPDKALWADVAGAPFTSRPRATTKTSASGCCRISRVAPARWSGCRMASAPTILSTPRFARHVGSSHVRQSARRQGAIRAIDRLEARRGHPGRCSRVHPWNCAPGNPGGRPLGLDLDPARPVGFKRSLPPPSKSAIDSRQPAWNRSARPPAAGPACRDTAQRRQGSSRVAGGEKFRAHHLRANGSGSPNKYLDTMSKHQQVGKIFLDYLRNDRAQSRYSRRARERRPCPCRFIGRTFAAAWRR